MTFWLIAIAVVVAVGSLVWWTSGRAKPDLRRRSIGTQFEIAESDAVMRSHTDGGGAF